MDDLEKDKNEEKEKTLPHKTGNIGELLKVGINSSINIDMSRLSSKGFSNLLEKAKKLQNLKKSKEKNNLDLKKEEFDSIYKKGKENLKKNNISLMKIPDNFEMLKKFSQRMSNNRKTNNNIKSNDLLNYTEVKSSFKDENYNGINTISNTNKKIDNNFNNVKTNTKENNNERLQENKKETNKESIDSIKKTITNNVNMEKRKYFQFYNIFNNLSSKSNKKERFKLKLNKNKNAPILNGDNEKEQDNNVKENNSINDNINIKNNNSFNENNTPSIEFERENYLTSRDNINKESENMKKISQIFKKDNHINNLNSNNSSFNQNSIYEKDVKSNSIKNNDEKENSFNLNNIYEKQDSKNNSRENNDENSNNSINLNNIYEKQDDNNNSINLNNFYEYNNNIYENNSNGNNNDGNNNSFNLNNIYEKENNDIYNNLNKNNIFENEEKNNYNFDNLKDEYNKNDYNNTPENNILNLEDYEENDDDNNDIQLKAMEYETVNSNYSIKQCNTVIEYSFREDINVSYCPSMEDKSKSIENFNNRKNQMLFQLFDGCNGEEVSNFLQQNFTHIYKQYLDETKGNIPRSLVKSFKEIDEEIKKLPKLDGKSSTGTIVHIIWENINKLMVYCGNVGNSRVSLVSPAYIIKLSQDQITPETKNKNLQLKHKKDNNYVFKTKIDDKEEKKGKIFGNYNLKEDKEEKENEYVYKKYNRFKYRKEKNEMNKIKNEGIEKENLCCIPFISKMEIDLSIKNQFLFLASDGIWDKVDEIEMQQIIINNRDTEQLCSMLIKNALYRDTKDNISIFSIKLT